ncbi:hypothetical protein ACAG96_03685 [Candidatus Izemoplasma sp. B36]|uniref:hypothetical protein n=1 Tax=Candidatus Izemoplasma sp. B36 TaxID=3242468 RepID=UPI0035578BD5
MFLSFWLSALFDILLVLLVVIILIAIGSIFLIRDLKADFKKVYRMRSKFHIEMRKIVNLIYNIYSPEILEPFTKVIIKNLPHEEKKILLRNIDTVYADLDLENSDNKYIFETYENMQKIRRKRDAFILVYNQKLDIFPFNLYAKIMKMNKYELYTDNE